MSLMCSVKRPKLRYEGEVVQEIRYLPKVTHRLEWETWKQSKVDCLAVFVQLLTVELVRPRDQLKYALESILQQELASENVILQEQARQREEAEVVEVMSRARTAEAAATPMMKRVGNSDVFLYGRDPENINIVIKTALHGIMSERNGIEIPTLTLHGRKIGRLNSARCREMLLAESSKHEEPRLLLIILEEFTSEMFSSFMGSGFVNAKQANGMQIITICWSTDYLATKHTNIWREFTYNVFVPNYEGERAWIPENEYWTREDMLVDELRESDTHACAQQEDFDASSRKIVHESVQKSENKESQKCFAASDSYYNQLRGHYAEMQLPQVSKGSLREEPGQSDATAEQSAPSSVVAGDYNDSAYSTMNPVRMSSKGPTPPTKPVVAQPQKLSETPVYGGQQAMWIKNRPGSVDLQHTVVIMEDAPDGDEKKLDEFPHEESMCSRIANFIVILYACVLD